MTNPQSKDLVVLVPDKNIEFTLKGVLTRHRALGIRQLGCDLFVHTHRDPGCLLTGPDFLRPFANRYAHALMLFDREGCGRERETRAGLEQEVESRLALAGWDDRAAVIVLEPEIEAWVWSDSPHVAAVLGWEGRNPDGLFDLQQPKPARPKEAMESALREVRKSRSSALFLQLAERVSFNHCIDPAFLKLKRTLQQWFSQAP